MKVGINVSWMTPGHVGGMEWYVRNLIQHLGVVDEENEYVLVAGLNNYRTFQLPSPRWKKIIYSGYENSPMAFKVTPGIPAPGGRRFPFLRRIYRGLKSLRTGSWTGKFADLIEREGIQIWFCPLIYALPIDIDIPTVITIPDLQHEYYPEFFSDEELSFRTMGYQYSCKASTAIIGISKHVAEDIVKSYDIEPERVFSTPLALDQSYEISQAEIERLANIVRLKFRIDNDFIFYPANGWKHKNHENLIEALRIVHQQHPHIHLILTGYELDVLDRIKPLINAYGLHQSVRHLGYVSREDVVGLYAASKLLIFPSRFEGFGLPILEAMQFGVPVACSNIGSLPEVGGEAVLYFDPQAPEEISAAINNCIGNEDIRSNLLANGKNQMRCFSYFNTAKQTLAVFEAIRDGKLVPPQFPPFRPLIAHNWLKDGHSRWYFRANSNFSVHFDVIQPTLLPELKEQSIEVYIDDKKVVNSMIEPQNLYQFAYSCENGVGSKLHRLDIVATARKAIAGEVLSVQVPSIHISDDYGRGLRLTQ